MPRCENEVIHHLLIKHNLYIHLYHIYIVYLYLFFIFEFTVAMGNMVRYHIVNFFYFTSSDSISINYSTYSEMF